MKQPTKLIINKERKAGVQREQEEEETHGKYPNLGLKNKLKKIKSLKSPGVINEINKNLKES